VFLFLARLRALAATGAQPRPHQAFDAA